MTFSRLRRSHLAAMFCALVLVGALAMTAQSQRRGGGGPARFAARERAAMEEGFRGVTAGGKVEAGLFSIQATSVSTQPVVDAANAFLSALSESQRESARFAVDDPEWHLWANQHFYRRQGVSFEDMDQGQRDAAFALMKAGLSAKGFRRSRDIMRLNYTLGEITSNFAELDEWMYYITIMGEPSATAPWGWQLDGHHLIVNYFVLGDQVVMTPTFMGSEPVIAESGKYKGVAVMQDEEQRGRELMAALNADQRAQAILTSNKPGNNATAEAFRDNLELDYQGIAASELDADQQRLLLAVVGEFVGNMASGHAKIRMEEVQRHLDRTYFAWVGGHGPESTFYYRVHSPVILIEFDHQRPVALPGLPRVPTLQHVHSVTRTPNGNDYGKDLLRQHYERSHQAELYPDRAGPRSAPSD